MAMGLFEELVTVCSRYDEIGHMEWRRRCAEIRRKIRQHHYAHGCIHF
jgi:hypothetical protein